MQDGNCSWHQFFSDFHRFSEASWSQVGIKNRLKIDAKKHPKNEGKQEASWRRLGGILEVQESPEKGEPHWRDKAAGRISGPLMRRVKGRKERSRTTARTESKLSAEWSWQEMRTTRLETSGAKMSEVFERDVDAIYVDNFELFFIFLLWSFGSKLLEWFYAGSAFVCRI